MQKIKFLSLSLACAFCLCGCGTPSPEQQTSAAQPSKSQGSVAVSSIEENFEPYQAPAFVDASFHAEEASGEDGVALDVSAVSQGYVAVSAQTDSRLKFQVIKDENPYTYDIASDGTPSIFPLQSGDGVYSFRVMKNIVDTKYAVLYETECTVVLENEFQPFLRPSDYVPYSKDSNCVKKAAELAQHTGSALGVVTAVYEYINQTVSYDQEKAASVTTGYMPKPDETLQSGKGICFDYAALAAAMLRSQGIPAKVVFGYVSPDNLYHAWNLFYTEETGWVTVDYQVSSNSWNRLDLTFTANGADSNFIGDGSNYTDVYYY